MYEDDDDAQPHNYTSSYRKSLQHHWQARFIVGLITISGCFIGLILSHIATFDIWNYWRISIGCFTLLSLGLCIYLRKKEPSKVGVHLWQELLLWLGVYIAGGVFSLFVHAQTFSNFQASLALLTCLAMTLFIAGILIESSFLFTGLSLTLFAAGSAYLKTYLYKALLPIALGVILCLFLFSYFRKKE